jgi:sugar lactone lactonase YvrE
MKKIIIAFATITLSLKAVAQEKKMRDSKMSQGNEIMMKDGKVTILKDGKTKIIAKDIVLPNGSIVSPDGIVKTKNGKIMKMKEGELIVNRANVMKMER